MLACTCFDTGGSMTQRDRLIIAMIGDLGDSEFYRERARLRGLSDAEFEVEYKRKTGKDAPPVAKEETSS